MIIKIDLSNAFNTTNRALTLDVISGRASRDYACGLKTGDAIPTIDTLTSLFGYFKSMRTCHAKLRYFDWDGNVHLAQGKTGGQQGDPLEMLVFNLTIHHLWGRVLEKFPPLVLLRDIHSKLLTQYDCKEVCAPSQSQVNVGAGAGPSSQSQDNIGAGSA